MSETPTPDGYPEAAPGDLVAEPRGDGPAERADPGPVEEDRSSQRTPGWREVLLVSAAVVVVVLGAAVITGFLPASAQRLIFHEPILIGVLLIGTVVVLLGVARRPG
jgi:anti-sigma-K factor RskA